jgi:hypothetical protein
VFWIQELVETVLDFFWVVADVPAFAVGAWVTREAAIVDGFEGLDRGVAIAVADFAVAGVGFGSHGISGEI